MSKPREPEQPDELDEEYQWWCEEMATQQEAEDLWERLVKDDTSPPNPLAPF